MFKKSSLKFKMNKDFDSSVKCHALNQINFYAEKIIKYLSVETQKINSPPWGYNVG